VTNLQLYLAIGVPIVMYEVQRENNRVIVKRGEAVKLNASKDSYVIYKDQATGQQKVDKLGDLQDDRLLLALANHIEIVIGQPTPKS
jgi:hypothetical protein